MTQPSVIITELDGALGVLPPSAGRLHAVIGCSSSGPVAVPATFGRIKDAQATYGIGSMVEAAAHYMALYGRPVLFVRAASATAGVLGTVTSTATGTTVVTATGVPLDDYEAVIKFKKGGTIAAAGITYVYSLDAGRTFSPEIALGVAVVAVLGDSGITFDFAAGTVVAGDVHTVHATGPLWDATGLQAALTALGASATLWELVQIVGPMDGAASDACDIAMAGMAAAGKYRAWVGGTRIPTIGETEAAYNTAMGVISAAHSSKYGSFYSGGCKILSSISGRQYRRSPAIAAAAREANVSQEIDIADVNLGSLEGVTIRDVNGNPDEHDESLNPGLDDLRFAVLRTWDGVGVYVNRPRVFSPTGSDFQLLPHRRVLNLAHETVRAYFILRLNKPILVNKTSGFILETEALEIEAGANAQLRAVLLSKPKASDSTFVLSRTDNLLSTRVLTGDLRVVPLAYPETIQISVGFTNPALQLRAA
jgi:hypothetical protein